MACLNQMGTCHSNIINRLVIDVWEWCIAHKIWLTASHIPGVINIVADAESLKTRKETEWSLNPIVFEKAITEIHFQPDIAPPLIIPRKKDTLYLPSNPGLLHPLHRTIKLLLCHLSGNTSPARAFQRQLQTLSNEHGTRGHKRSTNHTYNDGNCTVVNKKLILFQHLSSME